MCIAAAVDASDPVFLGGNGENGKKLTDFRWIMYVINHPGRIVIEDCEPD